MVVKITDIKSDIPERSAAETITPHCTGAAPLSRSK